MPELSPRSPEKKSISSTDLDKLPSYDKIPLERKKQYLEKGTLDKLYELSQKKYPKYVREKLHFLLTDKLKAEEAILR